MTTRTTTAAPAELPADPVCAPTMQRVILALAAKHGADLTRLFAGFKLTMEGYQPLIVEYTTTGRIIVAHTFMQNGDVVPDPDMEFAVSAAGWAPVAIQHSTGAFHRTPSGPAQADLANFAELWARNLEAQGWLAHSTLETAHEGLDPA
jgi:hypothetical protein